MNIVLDLVLLALLAVCVFSGYRKGVILSGAGVLILLISVLVGGVVAKNTAPQLAQTIEPYIGWLSEDSTDAVIAELDETLEDIDDSKNYEVMRLSFLKMGMADDAAEALAEEGLNVMNNGGYNIRRSVSVVFVDVLTYVLIFLIIFAVVAAALTIVLNVVSSSYDMPKLGKIDLFGGCAAGFLYGLMIIFVISWLLRYANVFLPEGLLQSTALLQFFTRNNLLTLILGM